MCVCASVHLKDYICSDVPHWRPYLSTGGGVETTNRTSLPITCTLRGIVMRGAEGGRPRCWRWDIGCGGAGWDGVLEVAWRGAGGGGAGSGVAGCWRWGCWKWRSGVLEVGVLEVA